MPVRLGKWAVVIALVFSVGGHWAFLQTVAWAGMAISFAKEEAVSTALIKTFNGKNPCKLCKFVDEGKQDEAKKQETERSLKKFDTFANITTDFWFPPRPLTFPEHIRPFHTTAEPPLTPPPLLG